MLNRPVLGGAGFLLVLGTTFPRAADTTIKLVDVATQAGLQLRNISGGPAKDYIVDMTGNGAALFDYDKDDDLDVLIVNGSTRDNMGRGGDPMVALYQNDGRGRFTDVTAGKGLEHRGWGMGTCVADYDNDGFQDIYITAFGADVLWRNTGTGMFTDVTRRAGVGDTRWSTSCAFGDYDRDGDVDLYVANYVKFDDQTIPSRGATPNCRFMGVDVFCGPKHLTGEADVLYRNNGDGTFADVTRLAGIADPGYYGFGAVFSDLNDDGWPDIYVANDSVPNLLFRNNRNGTFSEEGLVAGVALSGDGRAQAGMGVDAGDYNSDGRLDLIVTNFSHDHNTLYENGGSGFFTDSSYAAGIAATAGPYLGWGVGFVDIDNDGRLDVFIANGHVYPEVDRHGLGSRYLQRKQLFHNVGSGRFRDITEQVGGGLLVERSSRGAAFGDYDNDGDLDVLVINMNDRPTLLRNETVGSHHWVTIRLVGGSTLRQTQGRPEPSRGLTGLTADPERAERVGTKSNRDGLGARITLEAGGRVQTADVRSGGSYLSHSDVRAHFGLGDASRVGRVEIRWPSGLVETATGLAVDRFYVATEGKGVRQVAFR